MKNILFAIQEEQKLHSLASSQDLLKLAAQACFGPGHMIENDQKALHDLTQEREHAHDVQPCQYIGNGYMRVPLSFMNIEDLPLWNHLFVQSARCAVPDEALYTAIAANIEGITSKDLLQGKNGIRHSEVYRASYDPHYRVIKKEYVDYVPVLRYIDENMKAHDSFCFAIDGRCASGKSTLAKILKELYPCNVFHMDDYFLTPRQRNEERLQTPGGNVDYERFYNEIMTGIMNQEDIHYQAYDCQSQTLKPACHKTCLPYNFVEGSYAQHPYLQMGIQGRIFLTCDPQVQKQRLKQRSPYLYERFVNEWIPMEETYFQAFQIQEQSDCILDTTEF